LLIEEQSVIENNGNFCKFRTRIENEKIYEIANLGEKPKIFRTVQK